MEIPSHIAEGLKNIRHEMRLVYNPTAVYKKGTGWDAYGKIKDPEFDPRYEVWDRDAEGKDYRVMTLETPEREFLPPGEWLLEHLRARDPARYHGVDEMASMEAMIRALVDEPNERKRMLSAKAHHDLAEAAAGWWWECGQVKSAAGLSYRGQRFGSAGATGF